MRVGGLSARGLSLPAIRALEELSINSLIERPGYSSSLSGGRYPMDSVLGQFCRIIQTKLILDVPAMCLHRFRADLQLGSDLAAALPLADQLEDLQFAFGQQLD